MAHPSLGFLSLFLGRGKKKTKKGSHSSLRVCVGEVWETESSPSAAPRAGKLVLSQGCPLQQPVFKVL